MIRSASARISTALATRSSGSSTGLNNAAGWRRDTTSWQRTTLLSFSLPRSGYGFALMSPRPSTTLADLFTPLLLADLSSAVWASLRSWLNDEIDDGLAHGRQARLRRWANARAIISLPTGAGKTRVAVEAAVRHVLVADVGMKHVLWVAQTDELCEQAIQSFRQVWSNSGQTGRSSGSSGCGEVGAHFDQRSIASEEIEMVSLATMYSINVGADVQPQLLREINRALARCLLEINDTIYRGSAPMRVQYAKNRGARCRLRRSGCSSLSTRRAFGQQIFLAPSRLGKNGDVFGS